jgi:hypothetical protein
MGTNRTITMKSLHYKTSGIILLKIIILLTAQTLFGQTDSTKSEKKWKELNNSVKINVTNPMIFGQNCYWFGYERTIGDHQSFQINIGRFSFPKILNINTDSLKQIGSETSSRGFHISGEYRFYLSSENKYKSPHGVYIGPYATYNSYTRYFNLTTTNPDYPGEINGKLGFDVTSVGFQLGYQFIFWNRVSLDMVLFGPGIGFYKLKRELSTTLDPETEAEFFQKINDALSEKIPGYDFVIQPGSHEKTGSYNTTSLGFRYVIMLGIRF